MKKTIVAAIESTIADGAFYIHVDARVNLVQWSAKLLCARLTTWFEEAPAGAGKDGAHYTGTLCVISTGDEGVHIIRGRIAWDPAPEVIAAWAPGRSGAVVDEGKETTASALVPAKQVLFLGPAVLDPRYADFLRLVNAEFRAHYAQAVKDKTIKGADTVKYDKIDRSVLIEAFHWSDVSPMRPNGPTGAAAGLAKCLWIRVIALIVDQDVAYSWWIPFEAFSIVERNVDSGAVKVRVLMTGIIFKEEEEEK